MPSRRRPGSSDFMDVSIAGILALDGLTIGAVYALLALATVLVFAVTRIIFIPQGEFVAYGALTLAILQTGKVPGTVWLLLILAAVAAALDGVQAWRRTGTAQAKHTTHTTQKEPKANTLLTAWAAPRQPPIAIQALLSLAVV